MPKMIYILFSGLMMGFAITAQANFTDSVKTFPSLPVLYKENKFKDIERAVTERANLFLKGHTFQRYTINRPAAEILEEFKQLKAWRDHTWYSEKKGGVIISRPDFMIAQDLLDKGFYRRSHIIAFDYNHSDATYNSSTIVLNGQRFLALEAPTQKTLDNFFKLLQNYQVTQLVRLTTAMEGNIEKSYPYWPGKIQTNAKTGQTFLNLPLVGSKKTLPILYYYLDTWLDHKGIEAHILLKTLERVRKEYSKEGLLACHCSGGVGRTGTFIAGLLLLNEIDQQLAQGKSIETLNISVEKVVMQLSLQRLYMVAKPDQYLSLYRLVDLYLKNQVP